MFQMNIGSQRIRALTTSFDGYKKEDVCKDQLRSEVKQHF